jgi:hypothetical protein
MQESNTTLPMSPEDEMEAKIINRLQKTIVIKKIPSEKQKAHLDRLAKNKAGSRYKKVEPLSKEDTQEIPVTVVEKKVKKPAKKKAAPVPESSEASSDSIEEPVPKKRVEKIPKKAVRSKAVAKQAIPKVVEPEPPRSLFRKSLL